MIQTHAFTATGQSPSFYVFGRFNVSIQFSASGSIVNIERSFDEGSTWEVVESVASSISDTGFEVEKGVKYRFNCTTYSSGTINCRLGAPGRY